MTDETWHDLGDAAELAKTPLQQVMLGRTKVALSCVDGRFGERSHASNPNPMGSDPFTTPAAPGRSVTRPVDKKCAIRSRSVRVSSRGLTPDGARYYSRRALVAELVDAQG